MTHINHSRSARPLSRPGFTLIEAAFTTIIIGTGVVAMVEAQQSFLRTNSWSNEASSAAFLAGEIREMTRTLPKHDPISGLFFDGGGALTGWGPDGGEILVTDFDDVDDFDGFTFSWLGTPSIDDGDLPGPINGYGEVIPEIDFTGNMVIINNPDGTVTNQPMQGWSQTVTVEKVLPHDTWPSPPLANDFVDGFRNVDQFPLRVTVSANFQNPISDPMPRVVTSITWIVP